jgi:DNA polymerase III delta prime subunit
MTQKTTKWRTLPVFISSTFKDMDVERDMLKKIVVPKLAETLKSRRIELKIIDLRWGVNTGAIEENERESLVLKVCLDSIRNNRPFFVALLGDRYGWTPSQTKWENVYRTLSADEKKMVERNAGKSVTELEILFGALGNVDEILSRSLFYFRKETSYCDMPEALFVTNFYEGDEKKRYKLQNLKAQIRLTCNKHNYSDAIREYSLKWNASKNIFEDVDFCEQMYEHLLKEIEDEIADCTIVEQDIDRYEEEEKALNDFVYFLTERFTGREHLIARLKNFVLNRSEALILTGFSGCGKSAIFCKLYQELQTENSSQHVILAHSAGITIDSQYVETMLQLWNRQLSNLLQAEDYEIKETNKPMPVLLKEKFLRLSKKVMDKGYKLIILLDALDRFEDNKIAKYMQWLPENASLVATSLPTDAATKPQKIHPDLKVEDIDLFTEAEARIMVARLCTDINKEISLRVLDALLSKRDASGQRACASPLWLQLATNVLFGLDADDFREMRSRNESDEADKIEGFLCDLLDTFPADAGELFLEIINRAAKDFGHELTHKSMDFIAVSQAGLREKDLAALMGNAWDELAFASLRRWLGRLITEKGDNRRWTLAHRHLIFALRKRLAPYEQVLHKSISNYLLTLPDDDPLSLTAMYHLIKADDKPRVALFYAKTNKDVNYILTAFYNKDHSLLSFLSDAASYLDARQRCDYAEKLVRHFSELPWTDYDGYINLCKRLFHWIDTKTADMLQQRTIGFLCQSITQWCRNKNDHENLLYFSQIQVDCFTMLIKDNPPDEELKNSLAIALSCMGDYYTATGDMKTAMYYFEKILTMDNN